jgi:predicted RecA/RadA family phage recombinase
MAKNLIYGVAKGIPVVCTDPATPASGDPVRFGEATGVALANEQADGIASVDFTPGNVYDLPVKAVNGSGNSAIAEGDNLYYVDADTPKLSKKTSGRFFGFALEAVASGATDTIKVLKTLT